MGIKLKTIYGIEIDTADFENKGFGAFKEYVQQNIDKQWGQEIPVRKKKYNVSASASAVVCINLSIIAEDEQAAIDSAKDEITKKCDWEWNIESVESEDAEYDAEEDE